MFVWFLYNTPVPLQRIDRTVNAFSSTNTHFLKTGLSLDFKIFIPEKRKSQEKTYGFSRKAEKHLCLFPQEASRQKVSPLCIS